MKTKLIDTIDVSELFVSGAIFKKIREIDQTQDTPELTWLTDELSQLIDETYYLSHSGGKYISMAYKRLIDLEESGTISSALTQIAKMIYGKFKHSWNCIYNALVDTEYNPLDNYNMIQEETPDITHTKNVKQNITTKNDGYGFNSTNAVPQTESNISGDALDNEETNTESGKRTLTRSGNIGVTTNQQMLTAELDLRSQNHFMDIIMNDTDSILCLLTY